MVLVVAIHVFRVVLLRIPTAVGIKVFRPYALAVAVRSRTGCIQAKVKCIALVRSNLTIFFSIAYRGCMIYWNSLSLTLSVALQCLVRSFEFLKTFVLELLLDLGEVFRCRMSSSPKSELHERCEGPTTFTVTPGVRAKSPNVYFLQKTAQEQVQYLKKFVQKNVLLKVAAGNRTSFSTGRANPNCKDEKGRTSEFMDDGDYSSSTTSNRILTAVRDAATANKQLPVPVYSIQQELRAVHPFTRLKGDRLLKCLEREVKNGRLQKASGSCYTLAVQLDIANTSPSRNSSLRRSSKRKRTCRRLYTDVSPPPRCSSKAGGRQNPSLSQNPSDTEEDGLDDSEVTEPSNMSSDQEVAFEIDAEKLEDKDPTDSTVRKSSRVRHQPKKFQSLNHLTTQMRSRKRARSHVPSRICSECQSDTTPLGDDSEGLLLKCSKCKYSVHRSCSGFREKTWKKLQRGVYHCLECKRCAGCDTGKCGDLDTVLCTECDRMFHYECHMPNVKDAPNGWTCSRCQPISATQFVRPASPVSPELDGKKSPPGVSRPLPVIRISSEGGRTTTVLKYYPENENRDKTVDTTSSVYSRIVKADSIGMTKPSAPSPTSNVPLCPVDAFLSDLTKSYPMLAGHRELIDPKLGNLRGLTVCQILCMKDADNHLNNSTRTDANLKRLRSWSTESIADSLKKKGQEEFADVIRKHMIDGQSLVQLDRDDVLTRFGLPLGPALKMWRELCDFTSWFD